MALVKDNSYQFNISKMARFMEDPKHSDIRAREVERVTQPFKDYIAGSSYGPHREVELVTGFKSKKLSFGIVKDEAGDLHFSIIPDHWLEPEAEPETQTIHIIVLKGVMDGIL